VLETGNCHLIFVFDDRDSASTEKRRYTGLLATKKPGMTAGLFQSRGNLRQNL
jgi:hypothetical protein